MYTFQDLYEKYTGATGDDTTANITRGKDSINQTQLEICGLKDWSFTERTSTRTSTASQQEFLLPVNFDRLITVRVTSGSVDYTPREIADHVLFDRLNYQGTSVTQDYPNYYHIRGGKLYFYPAIASAGLTVTFVSKVFPKDMSADDYTTGTISAITNGATTVTGSGTTWTAAMIGRYIKMPDGFWYEVTARASNTSITIGKPYEGTTVAAGSESYTIGELPLIPGKFVNILWYRAASEYYVTNGDLEKVEYFEKRYEKLYEKMVIADGSRTTANFFPMEDSVPIRSVNEYPQNLTF